MSSTPVTAPPIRARVIVTFGPAKILPRNWRTIVRYVTESEYQQIQTGLFVLGLKFGEVAIIERS